MSTTLRHLALLSLILFSIGALSACLSAPVPAGAPPAGVQPGGATDRLQIFSTWVTGPEAAGLQNLYDLYRRDHPDVDILNMTAAGNANARAVLTSRIFAGDPPDTFQIRLGRGLTDTWVFQGYIEDIDELYRAEAWDKVFPRGLVSLLSWAGRYWSVPVGIERANLLWYNKQLFSDNDLEPPKTLDDFFRVSDTLKKRGITPLALGDNDTSDSTLVFETMLIGTMGPDKYEGLWTGRTDWKGPEVKQSLENFVKSLAFVNFNHSTLTRTEASDLVLSGKAAMMISGDWVYAHASSRKKADVLGWSPAPGNQGVYDAFAETFVLPRNVRNRQNAIDWLRLVGSKEGQEAFNFARGAICARTDCDSKPYGPYAQSAVKDFTDARIVPSLSQGAAVSASWLTAVNDIMYILVGNQDQPLAQKSLYDACADQRLCR